MRIKSSTIAVARGTAPLSMKDAVFFDGPDSEDERGLTFWMGHWKTGFVNPSEEQACTLAQSES